MTIIILDGCSSSGKTSTALALQEIMPDPYLYVSVDAFVRMLPPQCNNRSSEGIRFIALTDEEGQATIKMIAGPVAEKLLRGYIHSVRALAECGNNVIADTIISEKAWMDEIHQTFSGLPFHFIGLYAPLKVLERRELARREPQGLARGRFNDVYAPYKKYDLRIDTSEHSISEVANLIQHHIN